MGQGDERTTTRRGGTDERSEFDRDHAVSDTGHGRFETAVSDRWTALGGVPNGGHLLGLCLNALNHGLPHPDPVAVSAHFLRPAAPGPAEVEVERVRAGRRFSTGEARLRQGGKELVRVLASYGDLGAADGRTETLAVPPDLPPPGDCLDPLGGRGIPGVTISERVHTRMATVPGWIRGTPGQDPTMRLWARFADGREPDTWALAAFVDYLPPVVFDLGATGSSTIELSVHVRRRPAPGWLACVVSTRFVSDGLHEEDVEIWDSAGRLVAQSRQLALLA
jgi:acyl-CoA thioesterase